MDLAYVAGSYRAKNKVGVIKNIIAARKVAKELWKLGYAVICPHSNSALFSGIPEKTFLDGDVEILKRCDVMVLLSGWEESEGTAGEIEVAIANNITIYEWEDGELTQLEFDYVEDVEEL